MIIRKGGKLFEQFGLTGIPHVVLIDGEGVVRAQGIVNQREHLESLFEAESLGVGTMQEYLAREVDLPMQPTPASTQGVRA